MRYSHPDNTHLDEEISPFGRMSYALQFPSPPDHSELNSHLPVIITWTVIWFEPWPHPLRLLFPKDPDPYIGHLEPVYPIIANQ